MKEFKCILKSVIIAVILNLTIPQFLKLFATEYEKKPIYGVSNFTYREQFMHMMYHYSQFPIISSIMIALIVGVSITLNYTLF